MLEVRILPGSQILCTQSYVIFRTCLGEFYPEALLSDTLIFWIKFLSLPASPIANQTHGAVMTIALHGF